MGSVVTNQLCMCDELMMMLW